ncbi:MAG: FUSC family protein [Sarcina sp.]
MKQKIIGNTIVFIGILVFINIFKMMFGEANSIVGVAIITGALVLLQRDLTASPVENFINLALINVFTGICAYIANINMWIGIPINFIALFVIGYLFSSNLKAPVVISFGLQYFFMIFTPVQGSDFTMRIAGLIFGAFFIILLQMIANKNKLRKHFKNTLLGIIKDFINHLERGEEFYDSVNDKINIIKKIVYESRKKDFYMCDKGKKVTNIIYLLEKINIILEGHALDQDVEVKNYIIKSLKDFKISIENEKLEESNIRIEYSKYSGEALSILRLFDKLEKELIALSKVEEKVKVKFYDIPEKFKTIKVAKNNMKLSSLRFSYSVRLAIVGAISIFIVELFNIPQGKWIAYTIFSLTQPYMESSRIRSKQRIEGTLIGGVIIGIVFMVIKEDSLRGMVILFLGYLNPFVKEYRNLIIVVTASAVAATVIEGGAFALAILRLGLVIIGAVLATLGSKFIIPYKIEDGNKEIKEGYSRIIETMEEDIRENKDENVIKSLYLIPAFLETKLRDTNTDENEVEKLMKYVDEKRKTINEVYSKYYFEHEIEDNQNYKASLVTE